MDKYIMQFDIQYLSNNLSEFDGSSKFISQRSIQFDILQRTPVMLEALRPKTSFKIIKLFERYFIVFHPLLYSSPTYLKDISLFTFKNQQMIYGTEFHQIIQNHCNDDFNQITSNEMYNKIKEELRQFNEKLMQEQYPESFFIKDDEQITKYAQNLIRALKKLKSFSFTNEKYKIEEKITNEVLMLNGFIDISNSTQIIEIKSRITQYAQSKYIDQLTYYFIQQILSNIEFITQKQKQPHFLEINEFTKEIDEIQFNIEQQTIFYVVDLINNRNTRLIKEEIYDRNNINHNMYCFNNYLLKKFAQVKNQFLDKFKRQINQINSLKQQNFYSEEKNVMIQDLNSFALNINFILFKLQEKQIFHETQQWLLQQNFQKYQKVLVVTNNNQICFGTNVKIIDYQKCRDYQYYYKPDIAILYKPEFNEQDPDIEDYCLILFGPYPTYIIDQPQLYQFVYNFQIQNENQQNSE